MKKRFGFSIPILLLSAIPIAAFASGGGSEGSGDDILEKMSMLVLQLGVIVLAARCAGLLFRRLPVPPVLIELIIGIIIGPHLLGAVPLPGFAEGLFPHPPEGASIPVTQELYGIAIIASIIMLFSAGLETDLTLLLRFSLVGLAVGSGGVIASFAAGAAVAMYFFQWDFLDPRVLFLGVMGVSTSMGIIARILSEKRKMDSPEGVTVLASSVVDDTLGIIALTVVTSVVASTAAGAALAAESAGQSANAVWVVGKAVLVWLGFTSAGILFASPLAKLIKKFKTVTFISIFALGLAFILAGVFEKAGLAMIIGAYIMGLCLSKTDLADTVRDALEVINSFFVPVFFVVMGMLVDLRAVMSREVLTFGALYSLAMILAKIVGCGFPTLFFNFNRTGALRIGMSMVPRGEVTFIIAGIGLSSGVLDASLFGAAILMVLACDLISPPLISLVYTGKGKGVKKDFLLRQTVATPIDVASSELTGLLESRVVQAFRAEGFFVHSIAIDGHNVYHLRKDEIQIALHTGATGLEFESDAKDVIFIKAIAYEALLQINDIVARVKDIVKPENLLKDLTTDSDPDAEAARRVDSDIKSALSPFCIIPSLMGVEKRKIVEELVDILHEHGLVKEEAAVADAVMEREASMSTGMQHGVALPHCRTDAVEKITVAVGLSRKGVDYASFDGAPSTIFVMILSPLSSESSYIQLLANISALLNGEEQRAKLLECRSQEEIYHFFMEGLGG